MTNPKPENQQYPFEEFPWNDDPNDTTSWVDGDDARKAYDTLRAENERLKAELRAAKTLDALMADNGEICELHDEIEALKSELLAAHMVLEFWPEFMDMLESSPDVGDFQQFTNEYYEIQKLKTRIEQFLNKKEGES